MSLKSKIKGIIIAAFPIIKKLLDEEVIPRLKKRAYEALDNFTDDRIEDLTDLLDKIKETDNEVKKEAHIKGFRLGINTLKAIATKILETCSAMEDELKELEE